ncbi:MAG: O-antigen ligase family protein [Planctomycetota bacterium]|jgi:O-antigen ligase
MFDEAETEYADDGLLEPDVIYDEDNFAEVGGHDGWLAALLLFSIIFGPRAPNTSILSPLQFVDVVVVLWVLCRWSKSLRLHGGFPFSRRIRIFSVYILILTGVLLFSTMVKIVEGEYSLVKGAFYMPLIFIRMIFIAAIMASFCFGEKQVKQFAKGILIISIMSVTLAFIQMFRYWYVSGLIELFYETEWTRLERIGIGTRVVGTFGNTNAFGASMAMLAAVSLAIAIHMKGPMKFVATGTFTILAIAVPITTASRTAFFALVIVSGISLLLSLRGRAVISVILLAMLMIGMFIFVRTYADKLPLHPRIKMFLGVGGQTKTINEIMHARYLLWAESMRQAKESIIWGIGQTTEKVGLVTDNGYLHTLRITGIIGLGVYLLMLLSLFIRGIKGLHIEKRPFQRTVLLMSFVVLIIHMIFEITADFFWRVQYGAMFAAFMGLLCSLSREALDEKYYSDYYDYELAESGDVEKESFQEII